ncbi:MAG: CDP-diacylglycerol--serine O-phosphatidyltransferase [Cytophagales bacterium]
MKALIPNFFTSLNLCTGLVCLFLMLSDKYNTVYYLFFICLISDYLDGFFAKKLNTTSDFGRELDSLADLVSFGVVPSFLIFTWLNQFEFLNNLKYFSVLIVLFSAYRLAKFNSEESQTKDFSGFPTPANALLLFSLYYSSFLPLDFLTQFSMVFIIILSSLLMISEFRFFSLKFSNYSFKDNLEKFLIIFISVVLIIIKGFDSIYIIITIYILMSLISKFFKRPYKHNIRD